jgi:hypothetical protein
MRKELDTSTITSFPSFEEMHELAMKKVLKSMSTEGRQTKRHEHDSKTRNVFKNLKA